jgi:RNA 2',3'-cyclic 3'-phosphodiesterase
LAETFFDEDQAILTIDHFQWSAVNMEERFDMRAFIAIPLPEKCREMLGDIQQSLRATSADVRWVAIPSIHLTLKFLGEIESSIVPNLAQSLREATKSARALHLRIHGLGSFPNQKNPRVVWCSVSGDKEGLSLLQREVESVCAGFGFLPEDRTFNPHLTLGRLKSKRNLQPLLDCIKIGSDMECDFTADHYNIYQSTLKPQGAVYTVLETIALSTVR